MVCAAQKCALPCNATTCGGCCAEDQCMPGNTLAACGQRGAACTDCAALAAVCVSDGGAGGACQAGGSCGPGTCPDGCCDADGVCQPGGTTTACGAGGASCQACGAEAVCLSQKCVTLCNATTCPTGCCSLNVFGACEPGTLNKQCGTGGRVCVDCPRQMPGLQCYEQKCQVPPGCSCPDGCCDSNNQCQPGTSDELCGTGDSVCQSCTLSGKHCVDQACSLQAADAGCGNAVCPPVCDKTTCPSGCCDESGSGVCQQGITSLACGTAGDSCTNCLLSGLTCEKQECTTADGGPGCGSLNCQGCCDTGGNCQAGFEDAQCGRAGDSCVDCTTAVSGGTCNIATSQCETPDGGTICVQTCEGCCDGRGNCQGGFADTQCGGAGGDCQDCTALKPPSTCDQDVRPRVCTSQQTQCPAAYPACPAALREPAPSPSPVCSAVELESVVTACAGGMNTTSCFNFFNFESEANFACGSCLSVFTVDSATQAGIRACAAPYLDATCNHNSACIVDCIAESCFGCSGDPTSCEIQAPSGSCAAYAQADQCFTAALDGPAAVCNPVTYQGEFGAWLQAVAAKYCGP
jgi:hypothetical protein